MKSQKEILKDMTFFQKVSHIWYYYKWVIIGGLFLLGCAISLTTSILSQKDYVLNVAIIDSLNPESAEFIIDEMEKQLVVTDKQAIYVDTGLNMNEDYNSSTIIYNSIQKFNTLVAVGDYDVVIDEGIVPQNYSSQDAILDLRTLMTEEQQKQLKDRFYMKKDAEGKEIVAGLFIDGMPWTEAAKLYKEKPVVSVMATASNPENAKTMLQWILNYQ
jgi:hypothetical protein